MKRILICFAALLFIPCGFLTAQVKHDAWLDSLLRAGQDSLVNMVLSDTGTYRYQVIYTQINRNKKNKPVFTSYYLNADPLRYFNPASTVKMPLAFLSLEKLNDLRRPGVNKYTSMLTDSSWHRQSRVISDSTSINGYPSIAHYIKKALLVSDNDAYTRMYEFAGQQTINRRLHSMGYPSVRITRRFVRMSAEENRHTNAIRFIDDKGEIIWQQPPAYNSDSFDFSRINKMGRAYMNANDSLVNEPIDFTTANNLTLDDMHDMLQSVMFPAATAKRKRFRLTPDDYAFLYRYLSQYPSETDVPKYDTVQYYDSYVKFFFRDSTHRMPAGVRVFNKVGWAYGCLTDVSYIADFENKVEYMLAATIYVNSDGVMNDNKYDYETIGWPFFYKIGQMIYRHELQRNRKYKPDLSAFRLNYEKRKPDTRPGIRDADN